MLIKLLALVGVPAWAAALAVAVSLTLGGAWTGYHLASSQCQAASLRAEIAALKRDRDQAEAAASNADRINADLQKASQVNEQRIKDYESELAKRPDSRCTLTDGDAAAVNGLRDDGKR